MGPLLLLPVICAPWLLRGRMRFICALTGAVLVAVLLVVSFQVHYAAPAAAAVYLIAVQSVRLLWAGKRRSYPVATALAPAATVVAVLTIPWTIWVSRGQASAFPERVLVSERLDRTPGQDLVFVRYEDFQKLNREWVYNRANIDAAHIVWARDMGDEKNRDLIRYYGTGRRVWLLIPQPESARVEPYNP
jgi:hypothetical protein